MFEKLARFRKAIIVLFDLVCMILIALLFYAGTALRDSVFHYQWSPDYLVNSAILIGSVFLLRFLTRVYSNIWRYANTSSYVWILLSDAAGTLLAIAISLLTPYHKGIWLFLVVAVFNSLLTLASRFCYTILYKWLNNREEKGSETHRIPVAIVGAGRVGALLAQELTISKKSNYQPAFFIDRDRGKVGNRVRGLKVYAEDEEVLNLIRENGIAEIFIALNGLDSERASELYRFYSRTDCKIKIYDSPLRDVNGTETDRRSLREFQIEDLLFRKPIEVGGEELTSFYTGKTVLVTGGGGSIGSEICRQIAKCNPGHLVILDIYENNAYDIQQELIRTYGEALRLTVLIASVRDRVRMEAIFKEYRPQIVFHAAAHKHVPLMENNGAEAIKNNIFGTKNTADMAEKYGAEKFILISTDKAVNPTNIMGASKRMCEMLIQCRTDSKTSFAAVRFGNVLGSNGSVIPLFRRQIEQGGPVTITDKRIIRYFMTIPEASQLVIRAGMMAKSGELFVLDMGKPVRIYDLAVNMIRLSGLVPGEDIQIKEIGLRPGEKLYEELLIKTEKMTKTSNQMIFIEADRPLTRGEVDQRLELLEKALKETEGTTNSPKIVRVMRQVVPTYVDPAVINAKAAEAEEMKQCGQAAKPTQKVVGTVLS